MDTQIGYVGSSYVFIAIYQKLGAVGVRVLFTCISACAYVINNGDVPTYSQTLFWEFFYSMSPTPTQIQIGHRHSCDTIDLMFKSADVVCLLLMLWLGLKMAATA